MGCQHLAEHAHSDHPASLRGRVVLVHAFRVSELAVVALHTVFEHHAVMTIDALRAFIHEHRWSFPIGMDAPGDRGGPSQTMARYGLRGTPSCLVLDGQGRVRLHHFGQLDAQAPRA